MKEIFLMKKRRKDMGFSMHPYPVLADSDCIFQNNFSGKRREREGEMKEANRIGGQFANH